MSRFDYITTKEQLTDATINLDLYSADELLELSHLYKKFYPLNEMSYDRHKYIGLCGSYAEQIHFNIINIVILGNYFPENINHWNTELMGYVKTLFSRSIEKSVKRDKLILEFVIGLYIDENIMTYEDTIPIDDALKDEIRKGKNTDPYTAAYIENYILPYTEKLLNEYQNNFKTIFITLYKAFNKKDLNIFINELNKYII